MSNNSNPQIFDYTKDPKYQIESKFRSEDCNKSQQGYENHSIFKYVTDTNMFVNKINSLDTTPPFLNYIPAGIPIQSVDIENDLRGINRPNTRCSSKKWQSPDPQLAETVSTVPVYNKDPILKWDGKQFILTDAIS